MSLTSINVKERYRDRIIQVEGNRGVNRDVFLFAISTCMWCKLGKGWLKDHGYRYRYLDIDKLPVEEKNQIKQELSRLTGDTPSFPFLVVDDREWHSGYDTAVWEELLHE